MREIPEKCEERKCEGNVREMYRETMREIPERCEENVMESNMRKMTGKYKANVKE